MGPRRMNNLKRPYFGQSRLIDPIGEGRIKVDRWESCSTMVCPARRCFKSPQLLMHPGVDACNTVLEVLIFAAAMNLGQSWHTLLTLFGGKIHLGVSSGKT